MYWAGSAPFICMSILFQLGHARAIVLFDLDRGELQSAHLLLGARRVIESPWLALSMSAVTRLLPFLVVQIPGLVVFGSLSPCFEQSDGYPNGFAHMPMRYRVGANEIVDLGPTDSEQ